MRYTRPRQSIAPVLVLAALLASCAPPTPYLPTDHAGATPAEIPTPPTTLVQPLGTLMAQATQQVSSARAAVPTVTPTPHAAASPSHQPSSTAAMTREHTVAPTAPPTPIAASPTATPPPPTPIPSPTARTFMPTPPPGRSFATLDDFWDGAAEWLLEADDVGLPVGESDTVHRGGGEFWSYLHASHQSAGVVDACGDPAPFPGCVTLWKSTDGGLHFSLENPVCLFSCASCPCDAARDHTGQQQYPRVSFDAGRAFIVYEWGAGTFLRTSVDGLVWSAEAHVPGTGQWQSETQPCSEHESVGDHPNIFDETEFGDCLVGAPPGIYAVDGLLYVFVGMGRDPGHMGCYVGHLQADSAVGALVGGLRKCTSSPLFGATNGYGPLDARGADANPYFEFRTISSADVVRVGDHYYMAYEGVRGPSHPAVVDDQFALGFARTTGSTIDGPWEKYPDNPVIMDVANNWGIGHADWLLVGPATYLYTATSQTARGRYVLVLK